MSIKKNLPIYELKINPAKDSFVDFIALVSEPATESDFLAFSKDKAKVEFSINDERMELLGAAMIPDIKIFRVDEDGSEYNVFFSAETIRQVAQVFMQKGLQSNLNLDHTTTDADSVIFQSFIVDSKLGLSGPKELNLPTGSWVIGTKVFSQKVWKSIKSGERKGFSVQGIFSFFEKQKQQNEDISDDVFLEKLSELNKRFEELNNKK